MDYFQGVVAEYLRADRACFINTEFYLRNDLSENTGDRKRFWFIDILALHMRHKTAYLCEVTYAKHPGTLRRRLTLWRDHWLTVCNTLKEDARVPDGWRIRPWVFLPKDTITIVQPLLERFDPKGRSQALEDVLPWKYTNHLLQHEDLEPYV